MIDFAAVKAEHEPQVFAGQTYQCEACVRLVDVVGCLPYQLAVEVERLAGLLVAERQKVARVEAFATRLVKDGYSACIYESAGEIGDLIRAALADQPEQL